MIWWTFVESTGRYLDPSTFLWWGSFGLFACVIVRVAWIVNAIYRCPSCGEVPIGGGFFAGSDLGYSEGVLLNPPRCPNCGVRLGR